MNFGQTFLRGINYWPANKAMYWWQSFDLNEVEEDFVQLGNYNFNVVRFFLNWEDFQPRPDIISYRMVDHLKRLADLAYDVGIYLMPTFFCGHMSGVNWMPEWMLGLDHSKQRFPVYSNGKLSYNSIRNFYAEEELIAAQLLQIRTISGALADHPAVLAYDLGNESSNCVIPPNRHLARVWLELMTAEIRLSSPSSLITVGMHAEDLEEDRNLWPQDAAQSCDFLSMHGYPFYLTWVDDPFDYRVLPFLGIITEWLGEKPVLFQEFGAPTFSRIAPPDSISGQIRKLGLRRAFRRQRMPEFSYLSTFRNVIPSDTAKYSCPLWTEDQAAIYYQQALRQLDQAGMLGAMAWCFADYHPALWNRAPLHNNPHERHFGLFRHDGSAKLCAPVWRDYSSAKIIPAYQLQQGKKHWSWLNGFEPAKFYECPQQNLAELFVLYKRSGDTTSKSATENLLR